jgi:hypothetical protein
MYTAREYAVDGGLMSYGIDVPDVYRQIGLYAMPRAFSKARSPPICLSCSQPNSSW